MKHWLVKSEPYKYSWQDLQRDGRTFWDGVRNFQARNNLKAMQTDDYVLYYHSNEGKEIVGVAQVKKEAYPDPTDDSGQWVVVDLVPVAAFPKAVTLEAIKAEPALANIGLIKQSRLSVMPVSSDHFDKILQMGGLSL